MACEDEDASPALGELARALQSDRLVEIYVGTISDQTKPFRVQQVLLEELSDWFTRALKRDTFIEGEQARLHFPKDDRDVWEVLLHWAIKRTLPNNAELLDEKATQDFLWPRCWALGDKYNAQAFQNAVMMEMLKISHDVGFHRDEIKHAVELTCSGSPLRRLMAEELVWHACHQNGDPEFTGLDDFDGNAFMEDFLRALRTYQDNEIAFSALIRLGGRHEAVVGVGPGGTWREYMVGDHIPRRTWRWETDMWTF
ncbi:hypothetical protein LTR53_009231 [Teratosphaeriaceae sp. CCFEE 6253]|nr:hypothetical protein LTR53_009231 [Teratosphaeriaceae sp. CCFEE 6253]